MKCIFLCPVLFFLAFFYVALTDVTSASGYLPDYVICNVQAIVGNKSEDDVDLVILSSNPRDAVVMKPHSDTCITINECISSKLSDCSISEECRIRNKEYCEELKKQRVFTAEYDDSDIALMIGQKIEGNIGISTAMPAPPPGMELHIIVAGYSLKDVKIIRNASYYVIMLTGIATLITIVLIIRNLLKMRNFKFKNE